MADLKPSLAPNASALGGTERLPATQGGTSVAITPTQIRTFVAALGGALGAVDNAAVRVDGAGGATAQGSDLVIGDSAAGLLPVGAATGLDLRLLASATIEVLRLLSAASGVNFLTIQASVTGAPVIISLLGDTNAQLRFDARGTGLSNKPFVFNVGGGKGVDFRSDGSIANDNASAGQFYVDGGTASSTAPVYTFVSDQDTGVGRAGANLLSLIAGGVEGVEQTTARTIIRLLLSLTKTSTAAAATTTEYPVSGDFGIHHNTNAGARHVVFNDGGTLFTVQIT